MRVRTHRPRTSVRLIVATGVFGSAMLLLAAPTSAHRCSGSGQIDDMGGDVVAECHGQTPSRPGGGTIHQRWDAALLIAAGEHPKVIQQRLGHASIGVTLDTYGHLFDGLDEAAADRLDGVVLLSRAASTRPGSDLAISALSPSG